MKADFHLHTSFSADSETAPEAMIERAIELGMKTICITDHEDYDFPRDHGVFEIDKETYFDKLRLLQEKYRERLEILIGVEIGIQPQTGEHNSQLTKRYPFDFVIGSVHAIDGYDLYFGKIFEGRREEEAYRKTLEETMVDMRNNPDFDVLGHLDYIVRYGQRREEVYSYSKFSDIIDEILRYLVASGKGLEVNTAGWKYGLSFAHPHPDVLKRYKELGGEIITVGSDGHRPEHLAYDFHRVDELLKSLGFKYYTEFRQRKPYFCALQ